MKIDLVIILVNYNGFGDTQACLESIKKAQGEPPLVIVVDNASTENVDLKKLRTVYEKLKLLRNDENIGFGRANNQGIDWALENVDFNYILLLNNDTLVEPSALHHLKEAFKVDPSIGITTGKTMYAGKPELVWYGGGEINFGKGRPKIIDQNQKPTKQGADKARFVAFVSGCTMLFTKKSMESLKGFDKEFFMYCEDLELSIRAVKKGYKLYYEPKCVIFHKVGGSQGETKFTGLHAKNPNIAFQFYHKLFNLWMTFKKHSDRFDRTKFRLYFIGFVGYKFTQLMVFSDHRKEVFNAFLRLLKSIRTYHCRKQSTV